LSAGAPLSSGRCSTARVGLSAGTPLSSLSTGAPAATRVARAERGQRNQGKRDRQSWRRTLPVSVPMHRRKPPLQEPAAHRALPERAYASREKRRSDADNATRSAAPAPGCLRDMELE